MGLDKLKPSPRDRSIRSDSDNALSKIGNLNVIVDQLQSLLDEIKTKRKKLSVTTPNFKKNVCITTWNTELIDSGVTSLNNQIKLPVIEGGEYFCRVDWGDGTKTTIKSYDDPDTLHTYKTPGIYTVKIKGLFEGWNFTHTPLEKDSIKLLTLDQWGTMKIQSKAHYEVYPFNRENFRKCINLTMSSTTDTPDLTNIISLNRMFADCPNLSTINNITDWDVSKVKDFSGMFYGERTGRNSFSDDLSSWDVSSAEAFIHTFRNSDVNFNVGNWNMSNVLYPQFMFEKCRYFNNGGSADINNWNTSNFLSLDSMFRETPFNQPIGNWDTSKVISLRSIFRSCQFNQDISGWDISSATNGSDTFLGSSFNQDISSWNPKNITTFSRFLSTGAFSVANYDALLIAWAQLPELKQNVYFQASSKYSSAAAASRQYLIETWGWSISDGGLQA